MKIININLLLVAILICCFSSINAQKADTPKGKNYYDRLHQQALLQKDLGNWQKTISLYKTLIELRPNSFETNYEFALLYFYELNLKRESIPYFLAAIENMNDTLHDPDILRYTGEALMAARNYDKALEYFEKYNALPMREGFMKVSMRRYIDGCNQELNKYIETNIEKRKLTGDGVQVFNAGPMINSDQDEFAPRPVDGNKLIFTSSRDFDHQFAKNVFKPFLATVKYEKIVDFERLDRTPYRKMIYDEEWNLIISDFLIDLSKITSVYGGQIYFSSALDEKEYELYKMPTNINIGKISSVAISEDGQKMVFSAEERKSKKWNLYQTTIKEDGKWNNPEKIKALTSDKDEQYPFFSADGFTLYFSSTGFGSIGGYDIFKSTLQPDNSWSAPERLPEPINSEHNDIWFSITPDGKKAYFSSDRPDGFGAYDVYEVFF